VLLVCSIPFIYNKQIMGNSLKNYQREEAMPQTAKTQLENSVIVQNYTRRMMIAQQQAITRDRVQWLMGFYVISGGIIFFNALRNKKFPYIFIPPAVIVTMAWAYQIDFAYLGKVNRINDLMNGISMDSKFWFNPIDKPIQEKK